MSYPPNQWNMLPNAGGQPQQNAALAQGLGMNNPFGSTGAIGSPHHRGQPLPQASYGNQPLMGYGSPHLPQQLLGGVGMQQSPRSGSPALPHVRAPGVGQIAAGMIPQQLPQQPPVAIPQQNQQMASRPLSQQQIGQLLSSPQGRVALTGMLNKMGGVNAPALAHLTPQQKATLLNQLRSAPQASPAPIPQTKQHPHPPPPAQSTSSNFNFAPAMSGFPTQSAPTGSPSIGGIAALPRPSMPQQAFGPTGALTPNTQSPSSFQTTLPVSSQAASPAAASSPKPGPAPRKRKAPPATEREAKSSSAAPSPAAPTPAAQPTPPAAQSYVPSVLQPVGTPSAPRPIPPPSSTSTTGAFRPSAPAPISSNAPSHPGLVRPPSSTQNTPQRPSISRPQTVFFAGQPPTPRDRDADREAAQERERERLRALRAKENEHASRKRDSMRGQMRNEVARLMYAAGDVHEPDQNSVDYMEDLLTEFISDLCRPIAPIRPNPQSSRQIVPLTPAIVRNRLSAPNPLLRKYAERFDYMTHMSSTIAEARRVDVPTNEDLVKTVGSTFLGLQEGGGEQRKIGRPKKKLAEPAEPKEKKRPGPRKGWKNDNEALERVRQKKEVKRGKEKERIKSRLAIKSDAGG